MIQGLSKREKILLFAAALVLILYLAIQFAILPLMSRYVEALQERNYLRTVQAKVDADIADRPNIEAEHQNAQQRFESIKQLYPILVPNEEIVTDLTNMCITNGLSPTRLNITSPPYPAGTDENADGTASESLFTVITATMNVSGSYTSLTRLLDEVDSKQYVRVTNMTYTVNRPDENNTPTPSTITLNFELTYINP